MEEKEKENQSALDAGTFEAEMFFETPSTSFKSFEPNSTPGKSFDKLSKAKKSMGTKKINKKSAGELWQKRNTYFFSK